MKGGREGDESAGVDGIVSGQWSGAAGGGGGEGKVKLV